MFVQFYTNYKVQQWLGLMWVGSWYRGPIKSSRKDAKKKLINPYSKSHIQWTSVIEIGLECARRPLAGLLNTPLMEIATRNADN